MSKREDDLPDMEGGMTTAERRRRRRRGGLRVPSDNVPRRTGSHPVVAPVPEDPNLAVSIAYSFSADASGPVPRPEDQSSPHGELAMRAEAVPEAVPENGSARVRAPTTPREPSVPVDAPTTLDPEVAAEIAAGIVDDDEPEMTIEADEAEVVIGADGTPVAADDVVFDGKTREMPAMNLEALGLTMGDDEPSPREVALAPDAVPDATPAPAAPPAEAPAAPAEAAAPEPAAAVPVTPSSTVPLDASVDIELDEEPEAVPIQRAFRRTTTVALSEEDLEELMDAEAEAQAARAAATGDAVPTLPRAPRPARAATPELDAEPLGDDDLKDEVQLPADAADSGEILTEDLIEEVDAQSAPVAAPVPAEPAAAAAPVAEPAVPTAEPAAPPTPPPAAVKPPPAPKKAAAARAAAVAAAAMPGAEGRKRKKGKPWFEEIFDEDYLRTLPFLTPQATQQEARFVIESLGLEAGAQVLDLGCGYGRHAMELAARGFHVVGLDMSLPLLLRGADEAQRRGLTINFVHGDMRELDFDAQFDGAYCLFSTFGFFDDETNKKTAQNLARALKPGARVVLEILNRDYLIGDLPTRVWWEGDGCVVLEEVEFNYFSSRIQSNRSVVFDDGRQLEQEISIRAYSLHELGKLLHSCGFRVLEVSGALQTRGRFFGSHSRHIMVVAERRATKDPTEITKG